MIDLILLIGQSNAKGCGNPTKSVIPNENCYEYLNDGSIVNMGVTLDISEGCGTIAPAFSNSWVEFTGSKVCFIHYAVDGSRIKNWNHDNNLFLNEAIEKFICAEESISKKYKINKKYAIWIQGESDAKYGSDPIYYKRRIKDIASNLNKRCNIEKMFVSLIGYWEGDEDYLKRCEWIAAVQEKSCKEDENLCLASKLALTFKDRGLTIDEVHYSQEGLNELGKDIAQNMYFYYLNNKKPIIEDIVNLDNAKKYIDKLDELEKDIYK